MFAIAVTSVSISYFDQSILWLYMTMGFCAALSAGPVPAVNPAPVRVPPILARHRAKRRLRTQAASSAGLASPRSS
jgi:hypothetical protein